MPDSLSGTTGSDPASEETSANPVRYFDGAALVATTDLSSTGCGAPFGQSRTWTNQTAAAANLDVLHQAEGDDVPTEAGIRHVLQLRENLLRSRHEPQSYPERTGPSR